jgi:dihydroneopterin aldolase
MLIIHINDLTFKCIIGILPFERKKRQQVIINISFSYFYNQDSSNFIDYNEVSILIEKIMKKQKFKLIEDAIFFIRKKLKKKYMIKKLKIKISKPNILSNCIVSIEE